MKAGCAADGLTAAGGPGPPHQGLLCQLGAHEAVDIWHVTKDLMTLVTQWKGKAGDPGPEELVPPGGTQTR